MSDHRITNTYQVGRQNHISNPLNNLDGDIYADYDWDYEPPKTLGETLVVATLDNGPTDRYIAACHAYILREGYATEDGVSATVEIKE